MRALSQYGLTPVIFLLALATIAFAQSGESEIKVSADQDTRVGLYSGVRPDCTLAPLPTIRLLVAPSHGAVAVERVVLKGATLQRCLAINIPAFVVVYHSQEDYNGPDEFTSQISWPRGHKQLRRVWLGVSGAQKKGQGI
jgi:hypothetical protein